jgi:hypothetical protein
MRLIIQKKMDTKTREILFCLAYVLDLFLWHPILALALGILGFVGKGADPFVRNLGWGVG